MNRMSKGNQREIIKYIKEMRLFLEGEIVKQEELGRSSAYFAGVLQGFKLADSKIKGFTKNRI